MLDTKHVVSLLARPRVDGAELWTWDVWRTIAPTLSQWILQPAEVETASHQNLRDAKKPVAFPKLGWSESDAQTWTHRSPKTAATSDNWSFASTHVFSPPWATCVSTDRSPSIYVEIKSRRVGGAEVELLLVSLSVDLVGGEEPPLTLRKLLGTLRTKPEECLLAYAVRPFVQSRGAALVRAVDELTHSDIDRSIALDAVNRASELMDRRCRVSSDPWQPLLVG